MKTSALSVTLSTLCLAFAAIGPVSGEPSQKSEDPCAAFSRMATTLMKGRQAGVPIDVMMKPLTKESPLHQELKTLVLKAYTVPRYSSEQIRDEQVTEFGNSAYLSCAKSR